MTKDVLVTISGKRLMGIDNEDVRLIMPGTYSCAENIHTVVYEEPAEGVGEPIKNTIRIGGGCMVITKEGPANARMSFLNNDRRTVTCYSTPFGDFMIGIRTNDINIRETEDKLRVDVDYSMDVGEEHLSDCRINIDITSRGKSELNLMQ